MIRGGEPPTRRVPPAILLLTFLRLGNRTSALLIAGYLVIDLLHAPAILPDLSLG